VRNDQGESWHLYDRFETEITTSTTVIVATGAATSALLGDNCPDIRLRAGQIEVLEADQLSDLPAHNISYGGYLTASTGGMRTLGSSFEKIKTTAEFDRSPDDRATKAIFDNLAAATSVLKTDLRSHYSWRGVRAASPDYQPYVGPVPDTKEFRKQFALLSKDAKTKGLGPAPVIPGLYMLTSLGSKGFQHAPLLSELLVCMILGEPLPLPSDQLPIIHPARDIIKKIIRSARDS
jgi:tRNA 5-methylaminomethyl-2-thiouridine biosynthesis bifunctional protein